VRRESGVIRAWGLTGVGHPDALVELVQDSPAPDAVQCVANALDLSGDMWIWLRRGARQPPRPRAGERGRRPGHRHPRRRADALDRPENDEDQPQA
jgi:hypothetical protein